MNREPDLASRACVEVGMASQKRIRLSGGRVAKTVDIVMAIALGVGDADQRAERQILLHGKARLTGEVLARNEAFFARCAPLGRAGGVDHRLVDAFAGL